VCQIKNDAHILAKVDEPKYAYRHLLFTESFFVAWFITNREIIASIQNKARGIIKCAGGTRYIGKTIKNKTSSDRYNTPSRNVSLSVSWGQTKDSLDVL
jgi:hypothetical protein